LPTIHAFFALLFVVAAILPGCSSSPSSPGPGNATGSLTVTSTPAGAAISLDGSPTGALTDTTLSGLAPGTYTVAVALSGYASQPATRSVEVRSNETRQAAFALALVSQTGSIAVASTPPGARILLDGVDTGLATPDTIQGVAAGPHTVRVAMNGFGASPESAAVAVAASALAETAFSLELLAQSRLVLVDHFSNTSCDPCREPELALTAARAQLGMGVVVSHATHLNFPSATDPFYLQNPVQSDERAAALAIISMPRFYVDGEQFDDAADYDALVARIQAARMVAPLYDVAVRTAVAADSLILSGTIRKRAATPGDDVLVVAVIEADVSYNAANGLTHFDDSVRRYLPSTTGEPLALGIGKTADFRYALRIADGWAAENLEAIASVQSAASRVVYQTGSSR
jgi:hypothetical protein